MYPMVELIHVRTTGPLSVAVPLYKFLKQQTLKWFVKPYYDLVIYPCTAAQVEKLVIRYFSTIITSRKLH